MEIVNPIFDSAFKFLLEDKPIALTFLESLTGFRIQSVEIMPQELILFKGTSPSNISPPLSAYRLDFSAKIQQLEGKQQLIILEIQKEKHLHQTLRFRKYLGKQYLNSAHFQWETNVQSRPFKNGIPLFAIYLLGDGCNSKCRIEK